MNGKIVKVIDENGIEREAKVVTTIEENGSKYVIYVINRDSENSNLFVSKLDGERFLDIIDPEEKKNIDAIVKDMIKKTMEEW